MQISNQLPQFDVFPALFITSGEYEAHFYIAHEGKLDLKEKIKMPPREDAREKQMFAGRGPSSYTHEGRYTDDLRKKFIKKMHEVIHGILAEYHMEEIYIFAPKYVTNRIMSGLDKEEQKKVRMQFYKEYTKNNPADLLKKFQEEIDKIQKEAMQSPNHIILS